ncbi:peptidoglycan-binding protein [Pseudovibrio exalbescens]|uniref:peptidoglycan-binding protein n=1 Tax=Pseudovibrio exalbescens TaxID=197461 RepID=UPI002366ACFF|nr:peptidoglycan-binding protein [Pseudovibrio exalbescens]MDD7911126.1 peptidoglycan-binding protein [Pseudovibrio exalbescens]
MSWKTSGHFTPDSEMDTAGTRNTGISAQKIYASLLAEKTQKNRSKLASKLHPDNRYLDKINAEANVFEAPEDHFGTGEIDAPDPLERIEAQIGDVADALNELLPAGFESAGRDPVGAAARKAPAHHPKESASTGSDASRAKRVSSVLDALDRLDARLNSLTGDAQSAANRPAQARPMHQTQFEPRSQDWDVDRGEKRNAERHSASFQNPRRDDLQNLIKGHYDQLMRQISDLPPPADPRVDELRAHVGREMSQLRDDVAIRNGAQRQQLSEIVDRLRHNEDHGEMLSELRREIASMKAALSRGETEASLKALETGYRETVQRLDELSRQNVDPTILDSLVGRLHDLEGYLQQLPRVDQLEALDDRLTAMGDRLEYVLRQSGSEGVDALRGDIRNLRAVVDTLDSGRTIMEVDQRIRFLIARMDELEHFSEIQRDIQARLTHVETRLPEAGAYDQLQTRLETITSLLSEDQRGPDTTAQLDRVEQRLQSITDKLEGIEAEQRAPNGFEQAFERIESRIDDLASHVNTLEDRVANLPANEGASDLDNALLTRLEQQVVDLTRLVETRSASGETDHSVFELREEVHALRQQIATLATPEDIEAQVQALAASISQPSALMDDAQLSQIEDQISVLAMKLDQTSDRMLAAEDIESAIARMDAQISGNKEEMLRTVQMAAHEAVEAATRKMGVGQAPSTKPIEDAISELRNDLQSLLSRGERDADHSLDEVKHTLSTIADRISALDEARTKVGATPIGKEHQKLVGDNHARGVLSAFTKRHRHSNAEQPEQGVELSRTRDKTADFIAAARRAAQAAADEVRAEEAAGGVQPKRKSAMPDRARRLRDYLQSHNEQPSVEVPDHLKSQSAHAPHASTNPASDAAFDEAVELTEELIVDQPQAEEDKRKGLFKLYSRNPDKKPAAEQDNEQGNNSRRRAVVLAVAAVVLTLGAFQVFNSGLLSGSDDATLTAQTERVQEEVEARNEFAEPTSEQGEVVVAEVDRPPSQPTELPKDVIFGDMGDVGTITAPKPDSKQLNNEPFAQPTSAMAEKLSVDNAPRPQVSTTAPAAQETAPKQAEPAGAMPPEAVGSLALRQAAANGDAAAQFEVAVRFTEGEVVTADLDQAASWYRRAAAQGLAPAQYRLGMLYERGRGVERDLEKARDWYSLAAAQGNIKAMHNLAVLYAEGVTGEPDFIEAIRWFRMAADYGVADSVFNLGILTARGLGTPQDLKESYKWFAIAAQQGDQGAAQKRDEIANMLSDEDLAAARDSVDRYARKKADPLANEVEKKPSWTMSPATPISFNIPGQIRQVQERLQGLGYDLGSVDGRMGPRTLLAIKDFQRRSGLKPTGVVDGELLNALKAQSI